MNKIQEVYNRMNSSERFGVKFGLFPSWVEEYQLTHNEIVELMKLAGEILEGSTFRYQVRDSRGVCVYEFEYDGEADELVDYLHDTCRRAGARPVDTNGYPTYWRM